MKLAQHSILRKGSRLTSYCGLIAFLVGLEGACPSPNRRQDRTFVTPDGKVVNCVEPPADVMASRVAVTLSDSIPKAIDAIKASITTEQKFERIRQEVPGLQAYEVLDYRMCVAYGNGLITTAQYHEFIDKILPLVIGNARGKTGLEVLVMFVDSPKFEHIYDPQDLRDGRPNCYRFTKLANSDQKLAATAVFTARVAPSNPGADGFFDELERTKPTVLVIHRSTFQDSGDSDETSDQKLGTFLRPLSAMEKVRVLVYSRKDGTGAEFAAQLANKYGLVGRIDAFQFGDGKPAFETGGNPFDAKNGEMIQRFVETLHREIAIASKAH